MTEPTVMENRRKSDTAMQAETAAEIIAKAIRERSAAYHLISESELVSLLNHLPDADKKDKDVSVILIRLTQENDDLQILSGKDSSYYYSSDCMTAAYARILVHKLEGPLLLIAETVREHTGTYSRPVPLDIFMQPPFNLEYGLLLDSLEAMKNEDGYADIAMTTTSASTIYLYSSSHLETDHAVMLAEWLDVGQADNP